LKKRCAGHEEISLKYGNFIVCLVFPLAAMSCQTAEEKYMQTVKLGEMVKKECGYASRRNLGKMEDPYQLDNNKPVDYFSVQCPDGKNYLAAAAQDGTIRATECEYNTIETSPCWDNIK
jgi:hypothetical protein